MVNGGLLALMTISMEPSTDLSEAGIGFTRGTDMQWGVAGKDDDFNGTIDDISEWGLGDDQRNDDVTIPLFASDLAATPPDPNHQYHDAARNAYFRYQPMTRISEMTTTRSNVYAVWITIGFFEVEEAPPLRDFPNGDPGFATRNGLDPADASTKALYARVYPEGYQLGREMGSEYGRICAAAGVCNYRSVDSGGRLSRARTTTSRRAVRLRRRIE